MNSCIPRHFKDFMVLKLLNKPNFVKLLKKQGRNKRIVFLSVFLFFRTMSECKKYIKISFVCKTKEDNHSRFNISFYIFAN